LTEAGVTYAELVAANRCRIAQDWLKTSDRTIAEISSALGYTPRRISPASFVAKRLSRQLPIDDYEDRHELGVWTTSQPTIVRLSLTPRHPQKHLTR
jgi:hypothetical protein